MVLLKYFELQAFKWRGGVKTGNEISPTLGRTGDGFVWRAGIETSIPKPTFMQNFRSIAPVGPEIIKLTVHTQTDRQTYKHSEAYILLVSRVDNKKRKQNLECNNIKYCISRFWLILCTHATGFFKLFFLYSIKFPSYYYPLVKRVGYMFHYVCMCVCLSVDKLISLLSQALLGRLTWNFAWR